MDQAPTRNPLSTAPRTAQLRRALAVAAILGPLAAQAAAEITDKNVYLPPAPPPLPAAGQTFVDPTFGSTILRLTGPADGSDNTNIYSYWPTFNRSSTRLFIGSSGAGTLYDFNPTTMQISNKRSLFGKRTPDNSIPRYDDAYWSGSDPNIIYGHSGLKLWAYNVNNTNYTLVKDFTAELPAGHLFHMTKSADDQVFTFTKQDPDYGHTGNFAWRRDTDQIAYQINDPANTNELQVDKSGRYVMVSHNAQGAGVIQTTIVDLQTNTSTPLKDDAPDYAPGHGDLGHGFSVAADNWQNRLTGRSLADPHNPYTVISWGSDWSQGDHTSLIADDESWALTSKFHANNGHPSSGLYKDEILLIATDGSQDVRRLAHHQSVFNGEYWNTPRANISYDGKYVAFTSNWGDLSRRDVFILRIGDAPPALWNINAAGDWHVGINWTSGLAPNGIDAEAELSSIITATRSVYIDSPVTLGTLRFHDNNTYHLTGGASLTLQTSAGLALVDVQQGAQKINLPLIVASDTLLNVASGATLKISDPVTINAGMSLSQTGPGAVSYESTVTLQAGASISFASTAEVQSLRMASQARAELSADDDVLTVNSLSMDRSAQLDLGRNALIVKNASYRDVEAKVIQGFNGGDWRGEGITSSIAAHDAGNATAIGIVNNAELGYGTFRGVDGLGGSEALVRYTYTGDSDLSGAVNLNDFLFFLHGFEKAASANWLHGDYDYSGSVDVDDFMLFLSGLKAQAAPRLAPELFAALTEFVQSENLDVDLSSIVPEPGAASLLLGAALTMMHRRRRPIH